MRPIDGDALFDKVYKAFGDDIDGGMANLFMGWINEAPTLTPPNEALTLDELREMDGEPVWVDDKKTWAILQVWGDQNIDAVFPKQRGCFRVESVLRMKIYRRPPERQEDT